jgi:adenylate cyclase
MERRLAAIMVVDVVGYSGLMERDEEGTLRRLGELRKILFEPAVERHRGRVVKLTGDGALVEFQSVVGAVECAMQVQNEIAVQEREVPEDEALRLRIGINLGDVIVEGRDIYGEGVNLAARLEPLAEPGGLCLTEGAYEHVRGKVQGDFEDMGMLALKNITREVRGWRWPHSTGGGARAPRAKVRSDKPSLAVLPFGNFSESRAYQFLADALTEDIITLLARIPGFFVIARNSSFAYKGKTPDIRDVARELGVRYVVEGSLRPVGDQLRITVQLIEGESGNHIWADRFDSPADRIDVLQDEITLGIAQRLEPELGKAEVEKISRRAPSNLDAWSFYQQAHGLLSLKGWHRETFEEAASLLKKAIDLDPDFALAHAYLSLIFALGHLFGLSPEGEDAQGRAVAEAEQAMEIDGRDAAVLGYTGCALCDLGHLDRGTGILERAVEFDPSNAQAWVAMGTALIRGGKARKGIEMLRHGMRISPIDNRLAYWGTNLAYSLFRIRRIEEGESEARLACRRDEKLYMARIVLAIILAHQGRLTEARQRIEEALRLRPGLAAEDLRSLVGRRGIQILRENDLLA